MRPDVDPHPFDRNAAAESSLLVRDETPGSPRASLTSLDLCGLGMVLVGSGIPFAIPSWPRLVLLLVLIVIFLLFSMVQERWLTRQRHGLLDPACKGTDALRGSADADDKPRRKRKGS